MIKAMNKKFTIGLAILALCVTNVLTINGALAFVGTSLASKAMAKAGDPLGNAAGSLLNSIKSKCKGSNTCVQGVGTAAGAWHNAGHTVGSITGSVESQETPVHYPAVTHNATKFVIDNIAPYFDFDTDSCYPATMISKEGTPNPGLKPVGTLTQGCRNANFLTQSNSWFRETCTWSNNKRYCGYLFALYFQKDQFYAATSMDADSNNQKSNGHNHRHDIEHVAVWTTDNSITHVGTSAHGKMYNHAISTVATLHGKPKIVYHKDGSRTHAFRLASKNESAENSSKQWQQLEVVDWYRVTPELRNALTSANFHTATLEITGNLNNFGSLMNIYKPNGYPNFTGSDAPGRVGAHLISSESKRCLQRDEKTKKIHIWDCNYGLTQSWVIEANRIRAQNYDHCITASSADSKATKGKELTVEDCDGSDRQAFRMIAGRLDLGGNHKVCGDVLQHKTANGSKLVSWPCHAGSNQAFDIRLKEKK